MERVDFTFKRNGHVRIMGQRQAEILSKLGHGTYQTRDMAFQPMITKPLQAKKIEEGDGLDALDKEQLHALAKERDVKVHHMAGADKVRAALREAAQ